MTASPLCVVAPRRGERIQPAAASRDGLSRDGLSRDGLSRDGLIEANIDLVSAIARQVATSFPRHVEREELVRAGMIGLVEAADRYDGTTGVPFPSFAARRIRGAMIDSMRAHDWAPRSVRTAARQLDQAEHTLTAELGRTPTTDELATAAGMTVAQAARARHRETRAIVFTLDGFFDDDNDDGAGGGGLADVLHDPTVPLPLERLEQDEMQGFVQDAVSLLPPRHRHVIEGCFYRSISGEELAGQLGVSVSRVSQIKAQALDMLRDALHSYFGDEPERAGLAVAAVA